MSLDPRLKRSLLQVVDSGSKVTQLKSLRTKATYMRSWFKTIYNFFNCGKDSDPASSTKSLTCLALSQATSAALSQQLRSSRHSHLRHEQAYHHPSASHPSAHPSHHIPHNSSTLPPSPRQPIPCRLHQPPSFVVANTLSTTVVALAPTRSTMY